jgi:flagellar motility protein MotE (MotC chaperone)
MAQRTEPIGTQGNKRNSGNKTWKKLPLKPNFYVTTLVLFFSLLAVKVVISGIFLGTSSLDITSADVAIAQEVSTEKDQNLEEWDVKLRNREKELLEKEADLKKLEVQLLPLKEEVENRMAELNDLQNSLAAKAKNLAKREKALEDGKMDHLVKLYSSMEAGKAAAILDRLQLDIVVRILGNMKGKSAGEIMAMMTPDKGATISQRLSEAK